jgi:hypothetical protein
MQIIYGLTFSGDGSQLGCLYRRHGCEPPQLVVWDFNTGEDVSHVTPALSVPEEIPQDPFVYDPDTGGWVVFRYGVVAGNSGRILRVLPRPEINERHSKLIDGRQLVTLVKSLPTNCGVVTRIDLQAHVDAQLRQAQAAIPQPEPARAKYVTKPAPAPAPEPAVTNSTAVEPTTSSPVVSRPLRSVPAGWPPRYDPEAPTFRPEWSAEPDPTVDFVASVRPRLSVVVTTE